jgi:prolipoprotein diacylglyceryltransferase
VAPFFLRLGNFFNSEIIGTLLIHLLESILRDHFSPQDAGSTQIANPNDAYNAIANDPKFATLLEQVPVKHPTQLCTKLCLYFAFAALFFLYWKTDKKL